MFHEEKKTYLELFLENSSLPKKRERYFEAEQELAIIKYNDFTTSEREKNELFKKIIITAFKKTIYGVLEMRKFRSIVQRKINREELIEATFFRLVEKIHKFRPGMIGKSGQPVKAFSYFSTIAKNYVLELIARNDKILKNKADVETSIDLSILSEETLEKISRHDNSEDSISSLDDYITIFDAAKTGIVDIVKDLIIEEEEKDKIDDDFIKLGYCLKYLLEKWDKIEFMKKNEFMRILTLYTGLPQQKVSFLFKRFKIAVLKKMKPSVLNKKKKSTDVFIDKKTVAPFIEIDDIEEALRKQEDEINNEGREEEELDEEQKILNYEVRTIEEFEAREYKANNAKYRRDRKELKSEEEIIIINA